MAPEQISNLVLLFVPPAGSTAHPVEQSIPNLTEVGAAVLKASDGIPLEDAGTWTIQLSVVTATGALTGATSSFDVAAAEDGAGTTVAPPIVTNVIDPDDLHDDDGRHGAARHDRRHDRRHRRPLIDTG